MCTIIHTLVGVVNLLNNIMTDDPCDDITVLCDYWERWLWGWETFDGFL